LAFDFPISASFRADLSRRSNAKTEVTRRRVCFPLFSIPAFSSRPPSPTGIGLPGDRSRLTIPEAFADKLAHRAEAVFARHPFWQRKFSASAKASARQAILMAMRHWLAGVLAKEQPALFRDLPESFKVGHPLPAYRGRARSPLRAAGREPNLGRRERLLSPKSDESGSDAPHPRFVHGCELLPV
jgi:hypothetical protein